MKGRRIMVFGMGVLFATLSYSSSLMATTQNGIASVYSNEPTANGEYAHAFALTAAHRTLPFGTMVKVTNIQTGRSVVVRINDRGPFIRGRIIDLTPAGARAIGSSGLAQIALTVLSVGPGLASRSIGSRHQVRAPRRLTWRHRNR